jgi:hypothetical protein
MKGSLCNSLQNLLYRENKNKRDSRKVDILAVLARGRKRREIGAKL